MSCPKCKGPMCNIAFMGPAKMVCAAGDECVDTVNAYKGKFQQGSFILPLPTPSESAQPGARIPQWQLDRKSHLYYLCSRGEITTPEAFAVMADIRSGMGYGDAYVIRRASSDYVIHWP